MTKQVFSGGKTINPSEIIKALRVRKGLSARTLSLQAGLSPSYVSKVESGSISPSFQAVCCLCKLLDMTDLEVLFLVRTTACEPNVTTTSF